MNELKLELFWSDIPTDKDNPVTYDDLMKNWNQCERNVRQILHELSAFDNGDNYVLIRSAKKKGFYKTDDLDEIRAYKQECLNRGRNVFAPVRKINRVLNENTTQYEIHNNMRVIREAKGLKQSEVCKRLREYDKAIDKAMLSKMENGVCLPTPYQLSIMAEIYDCDPKDLVNTGLFI